MDNQNSPEYLENIKWVLPRSISLNRTDTSSLASVNRRTRIIESLRSMPFAPSVGMHEVPSISVGEAIRVVDSEEGSEDEDDVDVQISRESSLFSSAISAISQSLLPSPLFFPNQIDSRTSIAPPLANKPKPLRWLANSNERTQELLRWTSTATTRRIITITTTRTILLHPTSSPPPLASNSPSPPVRPSSTTTRRGTPLRPSPSPPWPNR